MNHITEAEDLQQDQNYHLITFDVKGCKGTIKQEKVLQHTNKMFYKVQTRFV